MARPAPYDKNFDFSQWQAAHPTEPLPGAQVDAELDDIELAIDQTQAVLNGITRDDGQLANKSVHWDTLDDYLRGLLFNASRIDEWVQEAKDAAEAAEAALNSFRGIYYGPYPSDPSADPLGNPPNVGDLYFNTASKTMRVYTAVGWQDVTNSRITLDKFTGNGATTQFTLSTAVPDDNQAYVFAFSDNDYVPSTEWSLLTSGAPPTTKLIFNVAPANGRKIEVRTIAVAPAGTPGPGTVDASSISNDPTQQAAIAEKIGALSAINNIAELYALADGLRGQVYMKGYYQPNDGGDGTWDWDPVSLLADNGQTVVLPTGQNPATPGRWVRIIQNSQMSLKAFGAVGDGLVDDTSALQAAFDWQKETAAEILAPAGRYKITSTVRYYTSTHTHALRLRGEGVERTVFLYAWANGTSFIKVRGLVSSQFMNGGYLQDFKIQGGPVPGDPPMGFWSQQCAIDVSNWIRFKFDNVQIVGVKGNGVWAPYRFASTGTIGRSNDKPHVWVDGGTGLQGSKGYGAHLQALVDPSDGHIIGFEIIRGGHNYAGSPTIHVTGCGSGFSGTAITTDGVITGFNITPGQSGSGYNEESERLYDNEDPFTTGLGEITSCQVTDCDGVAFVFPHFASSGISFRQNYVLDNASGGYYIGGNNIQIHYNSIAANGNHPTGVFHPGIWVRRTRSNAQNISIIGNELDSNMLCHVLVDGANPGEIVANRCNSWVTSMLTNVDFQRNIPNRHIAFESGGAFVSSKWEIRRNAHRAQPPGSFVPQSVCNCQAGVTTVSGLVASPLGASAFAAGMTVQITVNGSPITFGPGNLPTTTIVSVNGFAGTLTLALAPNTTGTTANAVITVIIPICHVTWIDLGRSVNTSVITAFEPFLAQQATAANDPSGWMEFANWNRTYANSIFEATNNGVARLSNAQNASLTRISGGQAAQTFPNGTAGAFGGYIPISFATLMADRGAFMELSGGLATGRYKIPNRGVYQIEGQLAVVGTGAAGALVSIECMSTMTGLDAAGAATNTDGVFEVTQQTLAGSSLEYLRFNFIVYAELTQTWIGEHKPFNASGNQLDAIFWWNPHTQVLQKYDNVGGTWSTIPYTTDRGRFLVSNYLWIRGRTNYQTAPGVPINTSGSTHSWMAIKQVG